MYLGADTPTPVGNTAATPNAYVNAIQPVGNVLVGLANAFLGKSPSASGSATPTTKASNLPLYIGGGVALLAGGFLVVSLAGKKKRRRR